MSEQRPTGSPAATMDRRPTLRFGLQVNPGRDEIDEVGSTAEAQGFDVISVADHVGSDLGSPMTTLARMAGSTTTIKLATMVINNDMRNPVQLAWEAVTLHRLSGGRFELGIGAGHTPQEYAWTGIGLDQPRVRKQRLAESVEIISALFKAETVDHNGPHYQISGASVTAEPTPIPILVGGNGTALLSHAALHADAIGLQGLGRIREDGHRHRAKFGLDHLRAQLATITAATTEVRPELGALVQVCEITEDREQAVRTVLDRVDDLNFEDAAATPYLAIGTVEEIARQVIKARDDWGISYFTTRSLEFGPVIARVRELEDGSSMATGNRPTGC